MFSDNQTLTMVRGFPGSGKSVYARQVLDSYKGDRVISIIEPEDYFLLNKTPFDTKLMHEAHAWTITETFNRLGSNQNVILCGNFHKQKYILPYSQYAMRNQITFNQITINQVRNRPTNTSQSAYQRIITDWEP